MFLEDAMIECGGCLFGPECEMHREVITDLKMVYYLGRYRAATAWSKVGKASAIEDLLISEAGRSDQEEPANRYTKTSPRYQPVG